MSSEIHKIIKEFNINDIASSWIDKGYKVDVLTLVPTYPLGRVLDGYKNRLIAREVYNDICIYRVHAVTGYKDNKFKKILKYINFMFLGSIIALFIGRKYDYVISLRAVETIDFMTAKWSRLPYDFLDIVSTRIINEVEGISRVTYDISSKPPATIEWE